MYHFVSCFVRKDMVYRPMWAKDTNGLFHSIEPVTVVAVADMEGLRRAFRDAMNFGHPVIPAIPWQEREKEPFVVLKYAGVKSLSTFQRNTFGVDISDKDGTYKVVMERRRRGLQGWEPDPDHTFILPPGSTLDDAIERAIQLIQEKSREQTTRA